MDKTFRLADVTIRNDGNLDDLRAAVESVLITPWLADAGICQHTTGETEQ